MNEKTPTNERHIKGLLMFAVLLAAIAIAAVTVAAIKNNSGPVAQNEKIEPFTVPPLAHKTAKPSAASTPVVVCPTASYCTVTTKGHTHVYRTEPWSRKGTGPMIGSLQKSLKGAQHIWCYSASSCVVTGQDTVHAYETKH